MTSPEISSTEIEHLLSLLGKQYEHLPNIAGETFRSLGKEQAAYFTNLFNDWLDIQNAMHGVYSKDELSNSLVYIYYSALSKEAYWFQLLFLAGNYPLLHRSLRYVWEMIFRAYHVDINGPEFPDDPLPPDPTIDDKVEWLAQYERKMFRWDSFVKPRLLQLLPQAKDTEMERYYKSLWDKLNEYVHPSKALLDRMVIDAPGFLMKDSFDKNWALETIEVATDVFDLVWLAIIWRFPECAEVLAQQGFHIEYPIVTTVLENFSARE
jgi:hypothetical protein